MRQLALLAFYLVFLALAMVLPTVRAWRQSGINPLVMPRDDTAEGFVGLWFKLVIAGLGGYLALGAASLVGQMGAIELPYAAILARIGWAMLLASLCWIVVAQWQMGRSWRVGIDRNVSTELVSNGLFKVSRNPIFLGMMVQLAGLALVMQDVVTALVFVVAYLLVSIQIRLEEAHLAALHGDAYAQYCSSVRRWV